MIAATTEVFYLVARGKGYYALDVVPLLIAAGAVAVTEWRRWRAMVVGLALWGAVGLPITLPILPRRFQRRAREERGALIFVCRLPKVTAAQLRDDVKRFS